MHAIVLHSLCLKPTCKQDTIIIIILYNTRRVERVFIDKINYIHHNTDQHRERCERNDKVSWRVNTGQMEECRTVPHIQKMLPIHINYHLLCVDNNLQIELNCTARNAAVVVCGKNIDEVLSKL